ncbi:hypothetical protein [Streptomyces sp. NBC_00239]|uniref:hypothetical protein n=1 Tax=Streptomyces sp. NBC_00239 TaxID=2903640 RepID=UPI002E2C2CEC|nr:hypothetical protein [Streptomyces sp. NBC_00239]
MQQRQGLNSPSVDDPTSGRVERWELAVNGDSTTATSIRPWGTGSAADIGACL